MPIMSGIRPPSWPELESVIKLEAAPGITSAEAITTLSADTLQREYSELIVRLSPGRRGMKLRDALRIAGTVIPETAAA